jgi:DNA-binding NarL/FixJ family response regulator
MIDGARSSGHKVSVLIADGDALTRRRVRLMLETQPDFDVVGEADQGELALDLARVLRPDLLLLGAHLPSVAWHEFAAAWKAELPNTRLVLLTDQTLP